RGAPRPAASTAGLCAAAEDGPHAREPRHPTGPGLRIHGGAGPVRATHDGSPFLAAGVGTVGWSGGPRPGPPGGGAAAAAAPAAELAAARRPGAGDPADRFRADAAPPGAAGPPARAWDHRRRLRRAARRPAV